MTFAFSPASVCPDRKNIVATSTEVGWTSVLLERHRMSADTEYENRATPDPCLFMLTRGQMHLAARSGGAWQRWNYDVGTAGLSPGGHVARVRLGPARGTELEISQLFVPPRIFDEAADHYRVAGQHVSAEPLPAFGFRDPTVVDAVFALLRAMADGAPNLYADIFAHAIATHLLSMRAPWRKNASIERSPGALADPRLARVIEYMSVHFAEPLDLTRLAREAGVSKFHFARLFRERTGTTPHRHLVDLRLAAARRMLVATEQTVSEVSAACGYENAAHFGAAFQRHHGVSPGAFRQQQRS